MIVNPANGINSASLTDSHCHLTFEPLSKDIDGLMDRARQAGVTHLLTVGQGLEDSQAAIELAQRFPQLQAAIGFGPHGADGVEERDFSRLADLLGAPEVLAIGEVGLDYYYQHPSREIQRPVFSRQVELAAKMDLPLIIHCREAWADCLDILDKAPTCPAGVFHCYTGPAELVQSLLDRGFYISFTGMITFKNAETCRAAARLVPHNRLLIETDAPYLSPEPKRNVKPNEPAMLVHTANFVAKLLDLPLSHLAQITTDNASRLFDF